MRQRLTVDRCGQLPQRHYLDNDYRHRYRNIKHIDIRHPEDHAHRVMTLRSVTELHRASKPVLHDSAPARGAPAAIARTDGAGSRGLMPRLGAAAGRGEGGRGEMGEAGGANPEGGTGGCRSAWCGSSSSWVCCVHVDTMLRAPRGS
jgi:hypothetical protein